MQPPLFWCAEIVGQLQGRRSSAAELLARKWRKISKAPGVHEGSILVKRKLSRFRIRFGCFQPLVTPIVSILVPSEV